MTIGGASAAVGTITPTTIAATTPSGKAGAPQDVVVTNTDTKTAILTGGFTYITPPVLSWDATTFSEASANDGSIDTVVNLTLSNDTFVISGGAMSLSTHYTVANVPGGLTVVITGVSTTTATVTLDG